MLYVRFSEENDARPPVPSSGSVERALMGGTWGTRKKDDRKNNMQITEYLCVIGQAQLMRTLREKRTISGV